MVPIHQLATPLNFKWTEAPVAVRDADPRAGYPSELQVSKCACKGQDFGRITDLFAPILRAVLIILATRKFHRVPKITERNGNQFNWSKWLKWFNRFEQPF